jgi:hypothetical protein
MRRSKSEPGDAFARIVDAPHAGEVRRQKCVDHAPAERENRFTSVPSEMEPVSAIG